MQDCLYPATPQEAIACQQALRARLRLAPLARPPLTIAGIDTGHDRQGMSHAAIVLLDAKTLRVIAQRRVSRPTCFPYIPGLLSFREVPVVLQALAQLDTTPDILMVDGQGVAHPRRLGIAAHLGVLTGLPAIGVAKSRLTGRYAEPGPDKGDHTPLLGGREIIGTVLRSKRGCRPLFVSAGHGITQPEALALVRHCLTRYRLPEPTRLADRLTRQETTDLFE